MTSAVMDWVDYDLGRHLNSRDAKDSRDEAVDAAAADIYPKGCSAEFIEVAVPDMPGNLVERLVKAVNSGLGMAAIGDVFDDYLRGFAWDMADNEITAAENAADDY